MPNKALTIDVNTNAIPPGSLDNWTPLGNTTVFIQNIITPRLSKNTNVGQLVSGIPTAFARVDLFKTALDYVATNGMSDDNALIGYYTRLVDEWRGLIACMALDYANIRVRKIDLAYSDGKKSGATANVYEPKGAFGNMLLRRANRWCEQNTNTTSDPKPFINVIKYRNTVVGATAPESLLFTSTGYKCDPAEERPWIDENTGKFIDPLRGIMTPNQVVALHAYVSHLLKGLDEAEMYYSGLKDGEGVDYSSIRTVLENWKNEIAHRAELEGFELSIGSTPPVSAAFAGPFEKLFCHKDILYGLEGVINEINAEGIEFDPKNLLLEEDARIAKLNINDDVTKLPILVMSADVKGMQEKAYFALPLSALGLNVFGKNIKALVGMSGATKPIASSLKATYDPTLRKDNLEVVLTLVTENNVRRQFKKVYTSDGEIKKEDILIWPNFISPQWDAYFMYNELPHNGTSSSYRAFPFVGTMEGEYFRILVDKNQAPVLLSKDGNIVPKKEVVDAQLLVISGENIADNPYKYEIYRSNKPFKGVRLQSPTGNEGGYLLINYSTENTYDWMLPGAHPTPQPVRLGIDFGSTNTSIAYSSDSTQEQGFEFENQRVSLMGNELPGRPIIPRENQVFFFQGAGPKVKSNAIKSVLTLHDHRRLPAPAQGETTQMRNEREVIGGFPCFADNLPFFNSDSKRITLKYPNGIGEVTQIHNMKWEDSGDDRANKSAFLRTLMLQVYAALFAKGYVPESIKWSYPSAMVGGLLHSYQRIWDGLKQISPVLKDDGSRYQLNVSRYTDTRSLGQEVGTGGFASNENKSTQDDFGGGFGSNSDSGFSSGFGGGFGSGGFGGGFGDGFNAGSSFDSPEPQKEKDSASDEDFMPDDPEKEVAYDPELLYKAEDNLSNPSLSEAEAVANFVSVKYAVESNVLNLCFDVGGSTTDISALFYLSNGVTMIKQNSVRFAAQRVSQAVAKFPQFKKVLSNVCAQNQIKMVGFNYGIDTYNEHTAPYFFDQIVNRLNDDQLEDFYRAIAADCPQLMIVNMYVTGLLMFYAGQLAHKLVDDLKHTPNSEWPTKQKPNVRVTFAGKGSRLFQWLSTIGPGAARNYYGGLFVRGFGERHLKENLAGWQSIELPKLHDENIKFEVSKGLAKGDTALKRPKNTQPSEIIGEAGYELLGKDNTSRPIEFTNSITPAMMSSIGIRLAHSTTKPQSDKFTDFCGFFYSAAHQLFNWSVNPHELEKACRNLSITAYIQNMPEFRAASREAKESGKPFSFVAPIIIIEGMKFYENTLLNLLK